MAETDVEEEEQHHKIKEIDDEEKLRIASPVDYSFKEMTELQDPRRGCLKKEIVDFHINEDTTVETEKPVDYSFKKLSALKPVPVEGARESRIGKIPERGAAQRKYLTKSIWLNNNKLTSIANVESLVNSVLEQPQKLAWLDFSFNRITSIDDSILKFPELKILYFHGNEISDLDEIFKLRGLKELKNVTFHGNPVAELSNYREYIIAVLPKIQNIDFIPVTTNEKMRPPPGDVAKKLNAAIQEGNRAARKSQQ